MVITSGKMEFKKKEYLDMNNRMNEKVSELYVIINF